VECGGVKGSELTAIYYPYLMIINVGRVAVILLMVNKYKDKH